MQSLKDRNELRFERMNLPEPVAMDYSGEIDEAAIAANKAAMPKEALDDVGILISGEVW